MSGCLRCLKDEVRYAEWSRESLGRCMRVRAHLARGPKRLALLARAVSLCDREDAWRGIMKDLRAASTGVGADIWREALLERSRLPSIIKKQPLLTRTVVLKEPSLHGEKGVLLTYFEYNLARLLTLSEDDLAWLSSNYEILFAASWCPTDYALLGLAAESLPDGLWIQPANDRERDRISAMHPKIRCLPGLACDWVDPVFYQQAKPWNERQVDILMVANWGAFKRHWDFFEALTKLPPDWRIVLVGQNEGRNTAVTIRNLADEIGVPQNLEIQESLPIDEVTALQCDSKISLVISRREGGCVAVVESLFAGCAVAVRSDACIGSAAHINARTGMLLRPGKIAEDLSELMRLGPGLDSAAWAMENVSSQVTLEKIQAAIKTAAVGQGRPWTGDLAQPHWRPYPVLVHSEDRERLRPAYQELHERFPSVIPKDLLESSCR
jgi:glycosyltransferase involved in cell wall biosynthesis